MSDARLAAGVEATAFLRRAQAVGGFGTVLHKGDESRGSLLLLVLEKGTAVTFLERRLSASGRYEWGSNGPDAPSAESAEHYVVGRRAADPDCWILELDVPLSERFIAETTSEG